MRELFADALHAWIAAVAAIGGAVAGAAISFVVWATGTRILTDRLMQAVKRYEAATTKANETLSTARTITHEVSLAWSSMTEEQRGLRKEIDEFRACLEEFRAGMEDFRRRIENLEHPRELGEDHE